MDKDIFSDEDFFRAYIVNLILKGETVKALEKLSERYNITSPKVKVGRVKRYNKALAVYSAGKRIIYVQDPEAYSNPFIMLHEYYHHLRFIDGKHRGTEKNADRYAKSFIDSYKKVISKLK